MWPPSRGRSLDGAMAIGTYVYAKVARILLSYSPISRSIHMNTYVCMLLWQWRIRNKDLAVWPSYRTLAPSKWQWREHVSWSLRLNWRRQVAPSLLLPELWQTTTQVRNWERTLFCVIENLSQGSPLPGSRADIQWCGPISEGNSFFPALSSWRRG